MKVISLCLLVVASASFVLATVDANAVESYDSMAEGEYMDVESYGFISGCKKVLWAGFKGANGTLCIMKEVVSVMGACTDYLDNIGHCTGTIPKDVQAIIDTAKQMITISDNIINIRSKLCSSSTTSSTRGVASAAKTTAKCFIHLYNASMQLADHMQLLITQASRLPSNTATCYVSATNSVVAACNAFVPNINTCISLM